MGKRSSKTDKRLEDLDDMIAEIIVDAYDDNEQLWAFRQVFEDSVALPVTGFVIGEPVSVIEVDYDGNPRRGLTVKCRRGDGTHYGVSLSDVFLPETSPGGIYIAAYRKWAGIDPYPVEKKKPSRKGRQKKGTSVEMDQNNPMELVVLSVKERTAQCRFPGRDQFITLRPDRIWDLVPGEVVSVNPNKQWTYGGHPYLSGKILSHRFDAKALNLVPLKLRTEGIWDPRDEYWREEGDRIAEWERKIIDCGPRPMFEMEAVLPGTDPDDPFDDPIIRSNELKQAGERGEAFKILMGLCREDLRCLDAHSHLGQLVFDHRPDDAVRHYEVGFRVGELSLGNNFTGVLPWSWVDNRPFLRCMHGYGLCLWRLGRFDEAARVFHRMLWLNPGDHQGVRFLIDDVESHSAWEDFVNKLHDF
jgi:hypothetical protein